MQPNDFATGNPESRYCRYCVDDLDDLKSYEEVFSNQVGMIMENEGLAQPEAEARVKQQLAKTLAWKNHI